MEDKDKNPLQNPDAFGGMSTTPPQNQNAQPENPTEANIGESFANPTPPPIAPMPSPTPNPIPSTPAQTPPSQKPSGGKGTTIIVGGILLLFVVIVLVLYWLILRQPTTPEIQQALPPNPIQQNMTAEPTPVNEEEREVVDIELEDDLEEDLTPIEQDVNLL